jgi:serine/threonine protein phosphatase 1
VQIAQFDNLPKKINCLKPFIRKLYMFGLFKRQQKTASASRVVPDLTRIYAVGDVHGCLAQLDRLLDLIRVDNATFSGNTRFVFLGDLVDRGPDSAGVIDRVMNLSRGQKRCDTLMGNHEEAMLASFDGTADPRGWLSYGGSQTLESYGIARAEQFASGFDLARRMVEAIPSDHLTFLRGLPDHLVIGDYLFVHAGIRPGVPIELQEAADLRWIRGGFLESEVDHQCIVVHGHTISPEPEQRANRIGIDTGCYQGGPLTALVLEGATQRFLQTTPA